MLIPRTQHLQVIRPFVKTKYNKFTYGQPYIDTYKNFDNKNVKGFDIVRTRDNKKSWINFTDNSSRSFYSLDRRIASSDLRGTRYFTRDERLVINVKNVDLFMNVGQGLEWDVWNFSKLYGGPYGQSPLTTNAFGYPYPGVGGPDRTEIQYDASKLSFFEFAGNFWKTHINVKNRQTIDDGKGGGYPTLQQVYLDYLQSDVVCGIPSNKYTYQKMIDYTDKIGDHWMRMVEQMVPATTIWEGGTRYENSIFHRQKYAYKRTICDEVPCFGSFVECACPKFDEQLTLASLNCFGLTYTSATWYNDVEINGTTYTGDSYYVSSGSSYDVLGLDIPSCDVWLTAMTQTLSGISGNTSDPNNGLQYYVIDSSFTGAVIDNPFEIILQGPCSDEGEDLWEGRTFNTKTRIVLGYSAITSGETFCHSGSTSGLTCDSMTYTCGEPVCHCPPGWDYNSINDLIGPTGLGVYEEGLSVCEKIEYAAIISASTANPATIFYPSIPTNGSTNYGRYGARWADFLDLNGNPLTLQNTFYGQDDSTVNGRLIDVGIWSNVTVCENAISQGSPVSPNVVAGNSSGPYGFSECVNVETSGEYMIGIAADNWFSMAIDGVEVLRNPDSTGDINVPVINDYNPQIQENFTHWHLKVSNLTKGTHYITLQAWNNCGSPGSFGAEIVGPFCPGELQAQDNYELGQRSVTGITATEYLSKLIFTTSGKTGLFEIGTYSCPNGYILDGCGDTFKCVKRLQIPCGYQCEDDAIPYDAYPMTQVPNVGYPLGTVVSYGGNYFIWNDPIQMNPPIVPPTSTLHSRLLDSL